MPILEDVSSLVAPTGVVRVEREVDGVVHSIETGKVAKQAKGAVLVRAGGTTVLVTAVMADAPREGIDFFPLLVDYREMFYAAGKIPGGFFRRESKPDERQTLIARLIDRPLRPLFPEGMRNEVIVQALVLSADNIHPPDVLAMTGASAALHISEIPWNGPIGGVRVGRADGAFRANPTYDETDASDMNILLAATREAITMVEAGAVEVSEEEVIEALEYGRRAAQAFVEMQEELREKVGKPKVTLPLVTRDEAIESAVRQKGTDRIRAASATPGKLERQEAVKQEKDAIAQELLAEHPEWAEKEGEIRAVLEEIEVEIVRNDILERGARPDGRKPDEIRPIAIEVGILPGVHGSALFTRGQTQALGTCTLGTVRDRRRLDDIEGEGEERFLLHYNFPPFSVGEAKAIRGPGRREIGHGALARRALEPLLPDEESFPYTIRVVSDILESNGSSSMASVCAGSLALMDAGVPIRASCAGIAMGLIADEAGRYAILTDIQGLEDHFGDMDFKVAGTREGITALQMDIKVEGLSVEILREALARARTARLEILDRMDAVLPRPRGDLAPTAPRIATMKIDIEKIRDVIGPGGKMIRKIQAETGVELDVEDDGTIYIASNDAEAMEAAREMIETIVAEAEVGKTYVGKVTRIMKFGAFVEILPGKEGLCHISQLAMEPPRRVEDVVKEGDILKVRVVEIDPLGRINVSHKAVLLEEEGLDDGAIQARYAEDMAARERERGGRGGGRGRDDRRGRGGREGRDRRNARGGGRRGERR